MNERIQELRDQAFMDTFTDPVLQRLPVDFCEKFAELIVRECAEVASDPLAFTDAAYCHARLLKHFGVES